VSGTSKMYVRNLRQKPEHISIDISKWIKSSHVLQHNNKQRSFIVLPKQKLTPYDT